MNKHIWARMFFCVVRVPWSDTRITSNNFGYSGLESELGFGFFCFGLGFRVSGTGFGFQVFCPPISKTMAINYSGAWKTILKIHKILHICAFISHS